MAAYTGRKDRLRLNSVLSKHLIADFTDNGSEVIAKLRKEKPVEYMKMVSAVLNADGSEPADAPTYTIVERRIIRPDDTTGRAEPEAQ